MQAPAMLEDSQATEAARRDDARISAPKPALTPPQRGTGGSKPTRKQKV